MSGDNRKHLAVIITLKTVLDKDNQPTEILEERGCTANTTKEVIEEDNEDIKAAIMNSIKMVNKTAISNAQHVHKIVLAPREFSLSGGELSPTLKVKRHFVLKMLRRRCMSMRPSPLH